MSEPVQEESGNKKGKKKKGRMGKLLIILLILVVLASAGFALWHFVFRGEGEDEDRRETAITSPPLGFTVNLADVEQRRYRKASVELCYNERRLGKEIEDKVSELRDLIIDIFRSKQAAEISTLEGTDNLRMEIKDQVNKRLNSGQLTEVFFTEFMIQ